MDKYPDDMKVIGIYRQYISKIGSVHPREIDYRVHIRYRVPRHEEGLLSSSDLASPVLSRSPRRISEYWDWFAIALFILITVDLLTTRFAAASAGPASEANPIMRWAIQQSVFMLTVINLIAALIAIASFYILMQLLQMSGEPYNRYLALIIEVWLGVLIGAGLLVFANNLSVIVHGRSLIWFG